MESISSNHMSVDIQASAALDWLRFFQPEAYCEVRKDFAETIIWDELGTHFDTEAMGVDIEWGSWLIDAIEATGFIWWEEGEPCAREEDEPWAQEDSDNNEENN